MPAFEEKAKATQRAAPAGTATSNKAHFGSRVEAGSILHLQRTIGNKAVQQFLKKGSVNPWGTNNEYSDRHVHDLMIPLPYTAGPGKIQMRLTTTPPADPCEQEAKRVAEQVLDMPEPHNPPARCRGESCSEDCPAPPRSGHEPSPMLIAGPDESGQIDVPPVVQEVLQSPGKPLDRDARAFMEPRLGHDFSKVRIHADPRAAGSASELRANAYTVGPHIAFAANRHRPNTAEGMRLIAHELTHVVQQGAAAPLMRAASLLTPVSTPVFHRSIRRVAMEDHVIEVELISSRDDYQPPGSRETYRVGDAAATRVLMDIQERGRQVVFRVFNFETGEAQEMSPSEWSFYRGAAIIGGGNAGITRLGRLLGPSQWRALWPNPMPEILRMFEEGRLSLDDEALLSGYHGMIRSAAARSLDENEQAVDEVLGAPDRVARIQEYATGLREASVVRDALIQRRDELSRRLVAQHSFTFGLPHAGTGPNIVQQLDIHRQRAEVEDTLTFWLQAFPLLTRLQTHEIGSAPVEARLREIKTNIVSTRRELNRGRLDPMTLDTVRARLTGRLGPRARAVVAAEDQSRRRWAIVGAVAATAATIGILFLPGGVFIDAAIGVAIAGHAVANAAELGRAANTGLHVDDGLVSQSQAEGARFAAVLATVFAVLGAAASGFRVLRVGLALRGLGRSMPELTLASRGAVARAIADDPALLSAFTRTASGDAAVSARVAAAVRHSAGNPRALRASLQDIARIAAIPRRFPTGQDLYEPLRRITDGSDIERIATQTGLSRAEVEAAKRNLMLDEHILVDDATGALYRSRFVPFEEVATVWGRAARGEALTEAQRQFLRRLVRHEHAEGALLSVSGRTLEQAFLRGELEGQLRTFLQSQGWTRARIDHMMAVEPMPITPYRYAHLVAALSGAPNP